MIDHAAGVAFVASQQRLSATGKLLGPDEMPGGAIFALDLNREPLAPRRLTHQEALGVPFHPRGCSLYCGAPGARRLLVISDRAAADHVVEMFDVSSGDQSTTCPDGRRSRAPDQPQRSGGPRWRPVLRHQRPRRPLAFAATRWKTCMAALLGRRWRSGMATAATRSPRGIAFANGMALDPARGRLYVAATRSKKIHAYAWNASDPAKELTDFDPIDLPGCPDNLEWDEEGQLVDRSRSEFREARSVRRRHVADRAVAGAAPPLRRRDNRRASRRCGATTPARSSRPRASPPSTARDRRAGC
ncbi:MAG: hypothetical protein MZW92_71095 [Comamonadaceae bacterium]|nr:hypothetical protein [Comamonadaceae bacterium]